METLLVKFMLLNFLYRQSLNWNRYLCSELEWAWKVSSYRLHIAVTVLLLCGNYFSAAFILVFPLLNEITATAVVYEQKRGELESWWAQNFWSLVGYVIKGYPPKCNDLAKEQVGKASDLSSAKWGTLGQLYLRLSERD